LRCKTKSTIFQWL